MAGMISRAAQMQSQLRANNPLQTPTHFFDVGSQSYQSRDSGGASGSMMPAAEPRTPDPSPLPPPPPPAPGPAPIPGISTQPQAGGPGASGMAPQPTSAPSMAASGLESALRLPTEPGVGWAGDRGPTSMGGNLGARQPSMALSALSNVMRKFGRVY